MSRGRAWPDRALRCKGFAAIGRSGRCPCQAPLMLTEVWITWNPIVHGNRAGGGHGGATGSVTRWRLVIGQHPSARVDRSGFLESASRQGAEVELQALLFGDFRSSLDQVSESKGLIAR